MSTTSLVLLAGAIVLLLLLGVLLIRSRARSSKVPDDQPESEAGEPAMAQIDNPPAELEKKGRYVLSGNFSGATVILGAEVKDEDLVVGPDEPNSAEPQEPSLA